MTQPEFQVGYDLPPHRSETVACNTVSASRRAAETKRCGRMTLRKRIWLASACLALLGLPAMHLFAEGPGTGKKYIPLDQTVQPGVAGTWANRLQPDTVGYIQTVRFVPPAVEEESGEKVPSGTVSVYGNPRQASVEQTGSTLAGLLVGPVYRFKLSEMPAYPGIELYPTVELIDRLHPPPGQEARFPVPIAFTDEEIQAAIEGRMVMKVVYLEQPDRASPFAATEALPTENLQVLQNPLEEADIRGRPVAIVRMGGRLPDPSGKDPGFYGTGAPVTAISQELPPPPEPGPAPKPRSYDSVRKGQPAPQADATAKPNRLTTRDKTSPDRVGRKTSPNAGAVR